MNQASDAFVTLDLELCGKLADGLEHCVPLEIPAAGCRAEDLLELAGQRYHALAPHIAAGRVKLCVNDAIVAPGSPVSPRDSVALFPPVSGG